jgi:Lrp/AsnC family leucine-responsive transcriptional regulator
MLDATDHKILEFLRENARAQWKDIGKAVHMTGQAVAARVDRMTAEGIIRRFTVETDSWKLGIGQSGYITVFMKTNDHDGFLRFVRECEGIREAGRISGEGCYLLKFAVSDQEELNRLLNDILVYGNYRLNIVVDNVK